MDSTKRTRQQKISNLVGKCSISSQEELSELLRQERVIVTQSTLSRDIRELGLVKVRGFYRSPDGGRVPLPLELLSRSLQQLILQSGVSGNVLMVKTAPGSAHALGVVLDAAQWPEVLGTVAGDDTVFVLLRSARLGKRILKRIEECMG